MAGWAEPQDERDQKVSQLWWVDLTWHLCRLLLACAGSIGQHAAKEDSLLEVEGHAVCRDQDFRVDLLPYQVTVDWIARILKRVHVRQ